MRNSLPSYGRKLEGGRNIHFYLTSKGVFAKA